jgi:hypothetical protein
MGAEIGLSIVQAGLKTYEWEFIAMVCQSTAGDERMGRQRFISPQEQEANARLIAAAPELLSLVVQYRDDLYHPLAEDSKKRRLQAIEAVISKIAARSPSSPLKGE